jgi:hypothetical protein
MCGADTVWKPEEWPTPLCIACRKVKSDERVARETMRIAATPREVAAAAAYRPGRGSHDESALLGRADARRRPRPCSIGDAAVLVDVWGENVETYRALGAATRRIREGQ